MIFIAILNLSILNRSLVQNLNWWEKVGSVSATIQPDAGQIIIRSVDRYGEGLYPPIHYSAKTPYFTAIVRNHTFPSKHIVITVSFRHTTSLSFHYTTNPMITIPLLTIHTFQTLTRSRIVVFLNTSC